MRKAEDHQGRRRDKRRVQPLRQRDPVQGHDHQPAADQADDQPQHRLLKEFSQHMRGRTVTQGDQFDQHQGEEHRERVVGAGLDLQRRPDTRAQPEALRMHEQEYRRRVGGRHDRAGQKRFGPVEVQRELGDRSGDQRGQQYADRRQHHRWRENRADALEARLQPAIEQDQR